jgi:thymidylate synthase ThyX
MASTGVKIVTTRDISHQILRHRSFSFQEFLQRYATSSPGADMNWSGQGPDPAHPACLFR